MSTLIEGFLNVKRDFWDNLGKSWSLTHRDPVVGWYNEHNKFGDYETVLWRNVPKDQQASQVWLEYGCGPGRNMIRFNGRFQRIDGVDISPIVIEKAKINLDDAKVPLPNLWVNDGTSLNMISDKTYDGVFSVICMQHINSRRVRRNLYKEFYRVLKPGGYFCFQMGFGPGHPKSVDYMIDEFNDPRDSLDKDTRVENVDLLKADVQEPGFTEFDYVLLPPCHDEHPQWIWVSVKKPL